MFVPGSDITIGGFRIQGVHEVRVKRGVHSYVDTASIKLPSIARITRKDGSKEVKTVITGKQFTDGDPVTIKLGYNGELHEEFRGFVKRRDLNMPLEVECEGFSYKLRNKNVNRAWKSTSVSEVMKVAVEGTGITLQVAHDIELQNISCPNRTAADLLDYVIKASGGALTAYFIQPDVLYIGLLYTPQAEGIAGIGSAATVKLALGKNVLKDNYLKQRIPNLELIVNIKNQKSKRIKGSAPAPQSADVGRVRNLLLQLVPDGWVSRLKSCIERRENYTGYEGKITGFLQPFAAPGYKANITDPRYGERDGGYIIESVEVIYGMNGARRIYEIGPKVQLS